MSCLRRLLVVCTNEPLQEELTEMADPVEELLQGRVRTVEYSNGRVVVDAPRSGPVYMAGSFNPLHQGHRGMLAAAIKARQSGAGQSLHALTCPCSKTCVRVHASWV